MIGLDSNVLVRLATRDDEGQYDRARRFLAGAISQEVPAYVNLIVLVEFVWTLRRLYKHTNAELLSAILRLLSAANVVMEKRDLVSSAVAHCQKSECDFVDILISLINKRDGCDSTFTFDERIAQSGLAQLVP
jgi:predicted nucleic-acid-binding protein